MTTFYLGTHEPSWLHRLEDVPLFVSARRLRRLRNYQPATTPWALDSGGFTEIAQWGEWRTPPHRYAAEVRRWSDEIGSLRWAAPQDWMCEPHMLAKTGLTIAEHQALSVRSVLDLRTWAPDLPFVPVLQGWDRDDYLRHVDAYEAAGISLVDEPVVGVGSVCRRQATGEAFSIIHALQPLRLHGFGMKGAAIAEFGGLLSSADSMSWSYAGRRRPSPSCPKRSCSNCLHYALEWRDDVLQHPDRPTLFTGDPR